MTEKRIQALDRALDIIELLATEKVGLGVTEIGNRVGLHKSTVHRILNFLAERGYVEKTGEYGLYKLGLKVVEIASIYLNCIELKTESAPYLRQLAAEMTQPAQLATFVDGEVIFIEKIEPLSSIRMYSQIGKRIPCYCSAVGKALLISYSDDEIRKLLGKQPLKRYTPNTIVDVDEVINQVREARVKGWTFDDEEHEVGIRCVAAPIYDYRGKIIAAVSVAGSNKIISKDRDEEIAQYVMKTAKQISIRMGYLDYQ